jgi:hypothetical protein
MPRVSVLYPDLSERDNMEDLYALPWLGEETEE